MSEKVSPSRKVKSLVKFLLDVRYSHIKKDKIKFISNFKYQKTLRKILSIVYDYTLPIYLSPVDFSTKDNKYSKADSRLKKFLSIFEDIADRTITKTEAAFSFKNIISKSITQEEIELYNCIINKDLKLGLDDVDINKMYPGIVKYPVEFMLPGTYDASLDINFPVIVEPLFDTGERVKLVAEGNRVWAYNLAVADFRSLFKEHLEVLKNLSLKIEKRIEIDCILMKNGGYFRNISDLIHSTEKNRRVVLSNSDIGKQLVLYVFDVVIKGKEHIALSKRKDRAAEFVAKTKKLNIETKLMPHIVAEDHEQLVKAHKKAVKGGHKGIILKGIKSPYVYRKDSHWLTYKDPKFDSAVIIEVIPGTAGSVGCSGIIVKMDNGQKKVITNMIDFQRQLLWDRRNEVVGMHIDLEIIPPIYEGYKAEVKFVRLRKEKGCWR